jgi:arylsulfatase A-like enzyme
MMGYRTPNIDRIAHEGALFTDYYGQQSCTAGRAAFITGQSPLRTGLLKVGLPGAKEGLSAKDPTLADLVKPLGYMTGQFGKNHLGDRNEFLPTVHGFDEFFGNLYHLNAEEEPENPDYPKNPDFKRRFGPRGVLRCRATDKDDPTEDMHYGRVGRQTIENTGPLNRKRMETIDEEFLAAAKDFIERQHKAGRRATAEGSPEFVPPAQRIATFEQRRHALDRRRRRSSLHGPRPPHRRRARVGLRPKSRIGRLDKALDEAAVKGWVVVDMKRDWTVIYPFQR